MGSWLLSISARVRSLVVAPLAFGAFIVAFMIHQTNVFDAIGHHSLGFADAGIMERQRITSPTP